MPVIKIIGGHGRIAMLLAKELAKDPDNKVISLFRNPDHATEVAATGAIPEVFDLEQASVRDFVEKLHDSDYVVWSAGAGGKGSPRRTYEVDRDAAIKSMQAARQVGNVTRYIMVSYLGSTRANELDPTHPLYNYGQAKKTADEYLKFRSGLKWTIVNPGSLNNHPATGLIDFDVCNTLQGRSISRANVALLVAAVMKNDLILSRTLYKEIEVLDGETPIEIGLLDL